MICSMWYYKATVSGETMACEDTENEGLRDHTDETSVGDVDAGGK
jgi:hypothetical protein